MFRLLIAGWLFTISLMTGLVFFLPMIINGGAMQFYENNVFIRWGEFGFCAAGVVLGYLGITGKGR